MLDRIRWPQWLLGLFVIALLIRLIFIATLQHGFYFADGAKFMAAASHIVEYGRFPLAFDRAPLYAAFLAGIEAVFGDSFLAIRLVQAVMGACIAVVIAVIGRRLGGVAVGVVAGLLWCIYPMGAFIAGTIYPTTLLTLILALGVLCLLDPQEQPGFRWRYATAGLLFGLAALAKPIVLGTIPLIALWLLLSRLPGRLNHALVFVLAVLIALFPWFWRNVDVHGRIVPIEARALNTVVPWAVAKPKPKARKKSGAQRPGAQRPGAQKPGAHRAAKKNLSQTKAPAVGQKPPKHAAPSKQPDRKAAAGNAVRDPGSQAKASLGTGASQKKGKPTESAKPVVGKAEKTKRKGAKKPSSKSPPAVEMIQRMAKRFPREFASFFELYPRRVGYLEQKERDRAIFKKNNKRLVRYTNFGSNPVMVVSIISVGGLYLAAIFGIQSMVRTPQARRHFLLLFIMVMSFALGYATSWGKIRYRIPVDPYIILVSAWGLVYLWHVVRRSQYDFIAHRAWRRES